MSELENYFKNNNSNCIDKWIHYFEIYEFWFKKYKNKPIVILEIGVFQGGSLNMWRSYFGENAQIFGIDINPECKQFESENTKIFIGSQEDRNFLNHVKTQIPKIDILIDDGGHTMQQQIVTFEELYSHIKDDGLYLCEDLHTSYWGNYGGGYKSNGSFIEYSKNFIDKINAWHSKEQNLIVDSFTRSVHSIHYYDSILIIQKGLKKAPSNLMTGKKVLTDEAFIDAYKREEHRVQLKRRKNFVGIIKNRLEFLLSIYKKR